MPKDGFETDVLVVGAGPTGLTMAAQLAERGVRCRLIDRAPERATQSRALVVQARTLELFQKMGLSDALVARGVRASRVCVRVEGRDRLDVQIEDLGVDDSPYPFPLFVSQVETERVLEEHVRSQGIRVERPVELLDFVQDADGVTARVRRDGAEHSWRVRWLVGCDGAHSHVRKSAGMRFDGAAYEDDFVLADVHIDWDRPANSLQVFLGPRGTVALLMPLGGTLWRVIEVRADRATDAPPPTLGDVQTFLEKTTQLPLRLHDPQWLTRFRLHHRGVDRYRIGRVFVAGDAAHIHSPAGGQGMNTGIQDAFNLAWKLALLLDAKPTGLLLDSYDAERRPVGQRLLTFTDRLFSLARSRNPLVWRARNVLLPMVVPFALNDRARRQRVFRFISQLGIRYRRSAVVAQSLEGADAAFEQGPAMGFRAPDGPLQRARRNEPGTLFAQIAGTPHHLLVFGGPDSDTGSWVALGARIGELFARRAGRVETHFIVRRRGAEASTAPANVYVDPEGTLHRRYGLGERAGHYLVRPDGYVAFRAVGTSPAPLAAYMRRVFP